MRDWKDRFRRFMVGRYGTDELNRFLLTAVLVMILGNVFVRNRLVFWLEDGHPEARRRFWRGVAEQAAARYELTGYKAARKRESDRMRARDLD